MKQRERDLREVRLVLAGWLAGIPFGASIAAMVAGGNSYVILSLLLGAAVLWATVRRAAGWFR